MGGQPTIKSVHRKPRSCKNNFMEHLRRSSCQKQSNEMSLLSAYPVQDITWLSAATYTGVVCRTVQPKCHNILLTSNNITDNVYLTKMDSNKLCPTSLYLNCAKLAPHFGWTVLHTTYRWFPIKPERLTTSQRPLKVLDVIRGESSNHAC